MIRVSLSLLILIYLGLLLIPIFAAWLLNEFRRSQRERAAFKHVIHCRICAFDWRDQTNSMLATCPRCQTRNERWATTSV